MRASPDLREIYTEIFLMGLMPGICFNVTYNFKLAAEGKRDGRMPQWSKETSEEIARIIQSRSDDGLD